MGFVRFPLDWIHDGQLEDVTLPNGVLELKVLLALAIAKGYYQRKQGGERDAFPATLETLSDIAHVSRPRAHDGLQLVRQRGVVVAAPSEWKRAGVGRRTMFHRFAGSPTPFFMLPAETLLHSKLLKNTRVHNRYALAALKVYLVLAAIRNRESGISRIGYTRLEEYGIKREAIRAGIDLLINANLVAVNRAESREHSNEYKLLGIHRK
jgi:hypothetical protein